MRFINKMMEVVYIRDQTDEEKFGIEKINRMFTEYSVFLSDKRFHGSLELALRSNSEDDRNNVSQEERELIKSKLRDHYLLNHPNYKEPTVQLEF